VLFDDFGRTIPFFFPPRIPLPVARRAAQAVPPVPAPFTAHPLRSPCLLSYRFPFLAHVQPTTSGRLEPRSTRISTDTLTAVAPAPWKMSRFFQCGMCRSDLSRPFLPIPPGHVCLYFRTNLAPYGPFPFLTKPFPPMHHAPLFDSYLFCPSLVKLWVLSTGVLASPSERTAMPMDDDGRSCTERSAPRGHILSWLFSQHHPDPLPFLPVPRRPASPPISAQRGPSRGFCLSHGLNESGYSSSRRHLIGRSPFF